LTEIVGGVGKVTSIVADIAAASREQTAGIEQVNQAVMQMDDLTQQNAALVEEAALSSRTLELESTSLIQMMDFFRMAREPQVRTSALTGRPAAASAKAAPRSAASARPPVEDSSGSVPPAVMARRQLSAGTAADWSRF
jgi:methyl-accepting chemotaxis protein